jgi:hypothetical protein
LGLALGLLGLGFGSPAAAGTPQTPEQLIDQLAGIDCHAPGLYNEIYNDFWAVLPDHDDPPPQPPACIAPEAMRELVRLGPQALPALVKHIADTRPTGISVGLKLDKPDQHTTSFDHQIFGHEYDPRVHTYRSPCRISNACQSSKDFDEPYTLRVGDVCFVLIGQIANRRLVAARYQATAWVIVNSPVELPSLAAKVRADWSGVDAEGLRASLLADLHTDTTWLQDPAERRTDLDRESEADVLNRLHAGALRRLRFYYPDTYAALRGRDLDNRTAFEKAERDEIQP